MSGEPRKFSLSSSSDAGDGVAVGDDRHLLVGNAPGDPVLALDRVQQPALARVGDDIGAARGVVAVPRDQFAGDAHAFARGPRPFGDQAPQAEADAALAHLGLVLARRAGVGGDGHPVVVDVGVGEIVIRDLQPQQARGGGDLRQDGAAFQDEDLAVPVLLGRDLVDVDQQPAVVVLVVGEQHRAVGAGLLPDDDGEAVEGIVSPAAAGRPAGEDDQECDFFHENKIA